MAKNSKSGFSLLELITVVAIMAVLLATAGLSFFTSRRNDLLLEQLVQDLAAEIRLSQSKVMAIQQIDDGFIPKAAILDVNTGASTIGIYYLNVPGSNCSAGSLVLSKQFSLGGRGSIQSISPSSRIYLIYNSPFGKFFSTSSSPSFQNALGNSCEPIGASTSNITITLTNDSRNYLLQINGRTGEVTIVPQ